MYVKKVLFHTIIPLVYFILSEMECARILAIFPTPSISHQIVFRPLTHELVKRGHEVIVITTDPFFPKGKVPPNLTEIDVHDISYKNWDEVLTNIGDKTGILQQIKFFFERFASTFDLQLQTAEVKEILKKDRKYFDLLITEACIRPLMGISAVFDAPIIQFSSFGVVPAQYNSYGAPMHPLLFPTPERQRLYNLSLWEKGFELFKHAMLNYLIATTEDYDYAVMRRHFGQDVPTFQKLKKNLKMIFINEHPIWNDNRPVGPNIVFVGGIHNTYYVKKELPKDLKTYLDSSKQGVIYMSFGTNVLASTLPTEKINVITRVFSQLPYDVLFKWDLDVLPGKPNNVRVTKWVPQQDLLRHPKIKLFITQGGLQSTDEAIDAGIPLIGIPMLGDQWYNAEKYDKHQIGLHLNIHKLDEKSFKEAIETVINNGSYKENIIRLRTLMREGPIKPLDLAVYWVEHVIKHGANHLQPPTLDLGWIEYYEVKLVLVALSIFVTVLIIIAIIIRMVAKKIYKVFSSRKLKRE